MVGAVAFKDRGGFACTGGVWGVGLRKESVTDPT